MSNDMAPKGKNRALTVVIVAIIVLLIVILAVLAWSQKNGTDKTNTKQTDNSTQMTDEVAQEELTPEQVEEVLSTSKTEVEGASAISQENKVITKEGKEARNDVVPMTPDAPQQTAPVKEDELPATVLKLKVSTAGWEPSEIRVPADSPVTISITSADTFTHIFKFKDASLSAVAVGVAPNETRAITFQTPATAGEYAFFCDVPGHSARGETGVMIVE